MIIIVWYQKELFHFNCKEYADLQDTFYWMRKMYFWAINCKFTVRNVTLKYNIFVFLHEETCVWIILLNCCLFEFNLCFQEQHIMVGFSDFECVSICILDEWPVLVYEPSAVLRIALNPVWTKHSLSVAVKLHTFVLKHMNICSFTFTPYPHLCELHS